jgi:uncharacterized protein
MSEDGIFRSIESYENAINENRIVGSRCNDCLRIFVPPRPVCRDCWSQNLQIEEVEARGKLVTWTVIHISPPSYMDMAPYILGIVELNNGENLTGIVLATESELNVGTEVIAEFAEDKENASRLRWVPVS